MCIINSGLALNCKSKPGACVISFDSGFEGPSHFYKRRGRWLWLIIRFLIKSGPETRVQETSDYCDFDQSISELSRAYDCSCASVSLVFLGSHKHERVCVEVGYIPLQELAEHRGSPMLSAFERIHQLIPCLPDSVNRRTEVSVFPGQMTELVSYHAAKLFR